MSDELREARQAESRIMSRTAAMLRGGGICEIGHKRGTEHFHFDAIHAHAAAIARDLPPIRAALAQTPAAGPWLSSDFDADDPTSDRAFTKTPAADAGLDVMTLRRALERGLAAVDDEWTIEELAELAATEYAALTREALR